MMINIKIKAKVVMAWWFEPYVYCLSFFCALCNCEPDMQKVSYWAARAIKVKIIH